MKRIAQILLVITLLIVSGNNLYATQQDQKQNDTSIYASPEIQPTFPGGKKSLGKFLAKNLKYPKGEGDIDVVGKIWIGFVVEKNGRLTHFSIVKKLYPSFDAEALRVAKLMPKWVPGKVKNKPVRSYYTLPVNFQIED